jgi:hypothetical protein
MSAGMVGYSWPWISWAQAGENDTGWMQFHNLLSEQTARLDDQPTSLAMAGTSIAFVDGDAILDQVANITQGTSNPQMLLTAAKYGYFDEVTMNDRLIGWNQNSTAMVFDRRLERFVTLPQTNQGFSVSVVSHSLLVWVDPVSPSQASQDAQAGLVPLVTFDVIDTSALPMTASTG